MRRVDLIVAVALGALTMFSAATTVRAQRSDRVIVNRPDDPLNRDATRPDRSEYELRTTMTGTPSQVNAALKYAKEAFDAKPPRLADAEKHYLEAAKLNPKEGRAYMGLGTVYAAQDRVEDAIEAFQKSIEVNPKYADAYFNLGVIFVAIGKKDQAIEQYTALESLDKKLAKKLKEMFEKKFNG